jgi:ATP dependent DNA ligase domain
VTDFSRLRAALGRSGSGQAFLYAFDLLELDGQDLRSRPWQVRREVLTRLLRRSNPGIRLSEHLEGETGAAVFRAVCSMGLEGVIAKRRDRPYWYLVIGPHSAVRDRACGICGLPMLVKETIMGRSAAREVSYFWCERCRIGGWETVEPNRSGREYGTD